MFLIKNIILGVISRNLETTYEKKIKVKIVEKLIKKKTNTHLSMELERVISTNRKDIKSTN